MSQGLSRNRKSFVIRRTKSYSDVQPFLDSAKKSKCHRGRWSTDSWAWEIGSCSLSISAVIVVAIILFIYHGKSLPKLPYNIGVSRIFAFASLSADNIQLNTLVAILGTISKTTLLLTIASSISQFKWLSFADNFKAKAQTLENIQIYDEASRGPWGSLILLFKHKKL